MCKREGNVVTGWGRIRGGGEDTGMKDDEKGQKE
jgi:hypothetical protein